MCSEKVGWLWGCYDKSCEGGDEGCFGRDDGRFGRQEVGFFDIIFKGFLKCLVLKSVLEKTSS